MVELVIPKCPRCGADIAIVHGRETAVCKYCDAEVLVVDKPQPNVAQAGGSSSEIEKKKLAIELASHDLQDIQMKANQVNWKIMSVENLKKGGTSKNALLPIILLLMMVMMDLMLFPLFWFLQMWGFYGLTEEGCLGLGLGILIGGIAALVVLKVSMDSMAARKYQAAVQSPEHLANIAQYAQLQQQVIAAQAQVEKKEQELKALVQ